MDNYQSNSGEVREYRSPWLVPGLSIATEVISVLVILSKITLGMFIMPVLRILLWFLWGILMVLIFVYQYKCVKEWDIICRKYESDASNVSPNYLVVLLLGFITFSIYIFYWYYKQGNRIQFVGNKMGLQISGNGSKYVILALLKPLTFGITGFIVWYMLFKSRNSLAQKDKKQEPKLTSICIEESGEELGQIIESEEDVKIPVIIGLSGEYKDAEITVKNGEKIVVGRDPKNVNLVINGKKVSRKHCVIIFLVERDGYMIVDYSSNGTYLMDGTRIQPLEKVFVSRGTEIYIGNRENSFLLK